MLTKENSPYYVYKFLPKEWWYCKVCEKWHKPDDDKIYAYNVCVDVGNPDGTSRYSTSLPTFISCSEEYCKETVGLYNKGHYNFKERSLNPEKPMMI